MSEAKVRVLIAKPGLDGHDRGARVVARALREAGAEVIYMGLHSKPAEIVACAMQEDVHVIGLSILSGAHLALTKQLLGLLKENGMDQAVVIGGNLPDEDVPRLRELGVRGVFPSGSRLDDIVDSVMRLGVAT